MSNNGFKTELVNLLKKYDASICWGCHWSSDLHGVHGEHMKITTKDGEILLELQGDTISVYEINDQYEG